MTDIKCSLILVVFRLERHKIKAKAFSALISYNTVNAKAISRLSLREIMQLANIFNRANKGLGSLLDFLK